MKFTATLLTLDQPTLTGRIYPREEVEKAVAKLGSRQLLGRIDGDDKNSISFSVANLRFEGTSLVGDVLTLKTHRGLQLEELLLKEDLRFAPVGTAFVSESGKISDYAILGVECYED